MRRALALVALGVTLGLLAGVVTTVRWLRGGAVALEAIKTVPSFRWAPGQPTWVLLLGDDRRGGTGCGCSDAVHLVGLAAGGKQATILNIPRDLRVSIPGHGMGRINEAYARGGPTLAAQVVGQLVGVTIPYVLVTSFGGLADMIDELGGVVVDVGPRRLDDKNTGLHVGPGPVRMDGGTALAYSRSRKIFADGDLSRTMNQANLIISTLADLRSRGASAVDTLRYLAVLLRHTRTAGMSTAELMRLGRTAVSIDPSQVRSVGVPATGAVMGGAAYVVPTGAAGGLFADLRDDAVLQSH